MRAQLGAHVGAITSVHALSSALQNAASVVAQLTSTGYSIAIVYVLIVIGWFCSQISKPA